MKKGDKVAYTVRSGSYSAYVRTMHRDGSVTVEVWFMLDDNGKERGPFQGMKFRLYNDVVLRPFA